MDQSREKPAAGRSSGKNTKASRLRDKKSQIMVVAVETREARDAECLKEVELIWIRQRRGNKTQKGLSV